MNAQGPYYLNPYGAVFGPSTLDIAITVGRNGFVEIINVSNYNIYIALQSMGTVFQEARSKVLYKIVQDVQGTQMVHISTPPNGDSPDSTRFIRLPVSYQNGETGILGIFINTYQEDEIQWYAPVSLSNPPSQSSYYAEKNATGAFTLTLPNTATFFGVPASLGTCDLLGFDLTSEGSGAAASCTLTISNVNNQPDGSTTLVFVAAAPASGSITPILKQFPTPVPNLLGNQITFTLTVSSGFSSTPFALNAYYSLT